LSSGLEATFPAGAPSRDISSPFSDSLALLKFGLFGFSPYVTVAVKSRGQLTGSLFKCTLLFIFFCDPTVGPDTSEASTRGPFHFFSPSGIK